MITEASFGSWPSPLSAQRVTTASTRIDQVVVGDSEMWWSEARPTEDGRVQIVRRDRSGAISDVLPGSFSARSTVHEYGGGSFWANGSSLFFVDAAEQRLWRLDPGVEPVALTPPPRNLRGRRYADGVVTPDGEWIICVEERHPGEDGVDDARAEPRNALVGVPSKGGEPCVIADDADFVSSPRVSADGRWLAWIEWSHPDMPWDATRLKVAPLDRRSTQALKLGVEVTVAGAGGEEAIVEPMWDLDDRLWFCSDRSGWSKLQHFATAGCPSGDPVEVDHGSGDVALPPWAFGQARYAMLTDRRVVFAFSLDGLDHLAAYDSVAGTVDRLGVSGTDIRQVRATDTNVVYLGASFTSDPVVVSAMVGRGGATSGSTTLSPAAHTSLSSSNISVGRPISFPTTGGAVAHGIFYPPVNSEFKGLPDEKPPLIVSIHGGPTGAAAARLALRTQFWTTRGFAFVDVNYRGSTGFGRHYRRELDGQWGVVDVEDCISAATHLAESGHVDGDRLLIRGSSAGGFTVLSALTSSTVFAAGCVLYGVSDLEALARDTHKFESRYLDRLVAPYPEGRDVYVERSPLGNIDGLERPVIVFQGSEDRVVPPSQSEMIVAALDQRKIPHTYILFEGEGHGFRIAANVTRCLDAELSFYCQVLGIDHPAEVEKVAITHL